MEFGRCEVYDLDHHNDYQEPGHSDSQFARRHRALNETVTSDWLSRTTNGTDAT